MDAAGEPFEWCAVHEYSEAPVEIGADIEVVRLRLHLREADGSPAVGAAAFAALWRRTPSQHPRNPALRRLRLPPLCPQSLLHHPWQSAPAQAQDSLGPPVYLLEDAGGAGSGCMAESLNSLEDRPLGRARA